MSQLLIVGVDAFLAAARSLLGRREITVGQYDEMVRRADALPKVKRADKILIT